MKIFTWVRFRSPPSHDERIFSSESIDSCTGWWQANGFNSIRVGNGWVYRQDGNVELLHQHIRKYRKESE
jgi:hypothetical protein